jgi:hypothetical protein
LLILTVFERHELMDLQYGVIIESWRNVMQCGSKRRKYLNAFTAEERKVIERYYKIYSRWFFGVNGSGIPERHAMSINNYNLMLRAANFFANV